MPESTTEQTQPASGLVDIAILDDDADFRNYLDDFLKDEGMYTVRPFGHPEDLFLAAEQRLPDIVLLDMKMGEFRGDKVLEQLLARWPNLCVIIITGYPSLEDMRATFKLKVFDYGKRLGMRWSTSGLAARRRTACASASAIRSRCCGWSGTGP
jgi:CheY-like chemotaxis protein